MKHPGIANVAWQAVLAVGGTAALLLIGSAASGWFKVIPNGRSAGVKADFPRVGCGYAPSGGTTVLGQPAVRRAELRWEASEPAERDRFLRETMGDLVAADGGIPAIQHWINDVPSGAKREELLRAFEFAWSGTDPDAALTWAAALPDRDERSEALSRMLIAQASSNPLQAIENARLLGAIRETGLLDNLVQSLACHDPDAAQKWALALPPGEERDRSLARIASVQARSFPADAARFAVATIPPGPVLDEAMISIVHQWALRDSFAARDWVETFPSGVLQRRALREIAGAKMCRQ